MKLRSIREAKNLKGKRVLLRVDFNTPLRGGKVADATRIRVSLPTIEFLLRQKAKVILLAHLGRPSGKIDESLRLDPVAHALVKLLKKKVKKLDDCVGGAVEKAVEKMKFGELILLENTRFHPAEKKNAASFVGKLARLGDIFVNDAFGVAHRTHASNFGLAQKLPAFAGGSLEKEVTALSTILEKPRRPLVLILGGAKIDTKIGVLQRFSQIADTILLGGGLANTFLAAQGFEVGASLHEAEKVELAQEIMMAAEQHGCRFTLPSDAVCLDGDAEVAEASRPLTFPIEALPSGIKILDIGERSAHQFAEIIKKAGTVVWNGPVGLFELAPFEKGTKAVAQACVKTSATTILGGGDTLAALKKFKIPATKFTHISTGGGAMLEFLEGKKMPALEILQKS